MINGWPRLYRDRPAGVEQDLHSAELHAYTPSLLNSVVLSD
jgi:hypothetical protein